MASIRERPRKDGTVTWAVLYTLNGKQTSDALPDLKSAERYRGMVEAMGGAKAREVAGFGAPRRAQHVGVTVEEWLDRYIEHLTGVAKSTLYDYESYATNHINPVIGQIPLTQLSRDDISSWVNGLRVKRGPRKGEKPSGKTVANLHGFLAAALNAAVIAEKMVGNPAAGTRLPTTERPDMVFLTEEEFARVRDEVPAFWRPMVEFLVVSGARFGEVSALKPSDVNRKTNIVKIRRAWKRTYEKGGYELGPPKTKMSRRDLNIDPAVLSTLDYSGEWLFTNSGRGAKSRGGPVRVSNFRANVWRPAVERAGIDPPPRVHDLRHTCASWLIADGRPLPAIQQHLGHESIEVTVGVYGHLDRSSGEAVAAALGKALR